MVNSFCQSQTLAGTEILNTNNHTYRIYSTPYSVHQALTFCASTSLPNGQAGYLATVTSVQEMDLLLVAQQRYINGLNFWISGDDTNQHGIYLYNSGPEKGTLMYNTFTGESPYYSYFNYMEPSDYPFLVEEYVGFDQVESCWNNMEGNKLYPFVCEYGGMELPYIEPVRTIGDDNIMITNILNMNLSSTSSSAMITVNFKNVDGRSFTASNIRVISKTSLQVSIPAGTGQYNVLVSNGAVTLKTTFQYQSPHIAVVYLSLNSGSQMTITGKNFGTSSKLVLAIDLGLNPAQCINPNVIEDGLITCQLSGTINNYLSPINITVDKNFHTAIKPAFNTNGRFFSCFSQFGNFTGSLKYTHSLKIEGLTPFQGYIDSQSTLDLYKLLCRSFPNDPQPFFWTSVNYNSTTNYFQVMDGPKAYQKVNLYPAALPPTSSLPYQFNLSSVAYYPSPVSDYVGALSEFYIDKPSFALDVTEFPTSGGPMVMTINRGGTYLSNYTLTYQSVNMSNFKIDLYSPKLKLFVAPGFGGPFPVVLTTSLDIKRSSIQYIKFTPPTIIDIKSMHPDGGRFTITGANLYTDPTLLDVGIGHDKCTDITFITPHLKIACTLAKPSGGLNTTLSVQLSLNGTKAPAFNFKYLSMEMTEITPGYENISTTLTISGRYFSDNNVSVTIGSNTTAAVSRAPCYNPRVLSSSILTCQFDGMLAKSDNKSMFVNLTMAGFTVIKQLFYYANDANCPRVAPSGALCNDHGRCIQGTCFCESGWTLAACTKPTDNTNTNPSGNNGTVINPSRVDFVSGIRYLRELNPMGQTVRTLDMANIFWTADNGSGVITGVFNKDPVIVAMTMYQFKDAGIYQFAGQLIPIPANSIKIVLSLYNWSFNSTLHTLQVIMETKTNRTTLGPCSETLTTTGELATNSYHVVAGNSILQVKFASHLFVDERVVQSDFIELSGDDVLILAQPPTNDTFSLWTALNLPYFQQCTIDPSMVGLVGVESEVCPSSGFPKWKIIVIAVTCGAVLLAAAVGAGWLIKQKLVWSQQERKIMKTQMKMKATDAQL
ncbi:hypothetical protein SAMD00019534_098900 [Acytostelium subglobosum LB1]|uniref:hypothetical protein n=1 Tax=Acytostelium subglobosum LB1 TaxID=1410327 RepID=UPI000644D2AA|nr:hypothetical protein SAMD00019534_098900 [Acytostelium subglobosum LB1]GAM26715.1 hypothetical protein SAMD00019534_098900 [Acytostelium subglobosum LB1]|eukprot:XP_012750376.1 hypothetical protein SAMD00019534_098900 [Acytostelium subglobosum LB1]